MCSTYRFLYGQGFFLYSPNFILVLAKSCTVLPFLVVPGDPLGESPCFSLLRPEPTLAILLWLMARQGTSNQSKLCMRTKRGKLKQTRLKIGITIYYFFFFFI